MPIISRRLSDSQLILYKKSTLIPIPDQFSYCPSCLERLLFLYCAKCNQFYSFPIFENKLNLFHE